MQAIEVTTFKLGPEGSAADVIFVSAIRHRIDRCASKPPNTQVRT